MAEGKTFIENKIGSLARCISRLESGRASLEGRPDDVVALELGQSVQLCVELASHIISSAGPTRRPEGMAGKFDTLADMGLLPHGLAEGMKESIQLRNIFLDNCRSVNSEQLSGMILAHIGNARRFAEEISSLPDRG
ncbi:MAG TPA: hypothetical protein ENN89_00565 [Synergistetes bacterium]|nr:hypothetical protein [Synergistota bacterium]